jgi:hypothetical protein
MAQAVNRRPPTAEARVRSRVSPCGICGGQSGTGTVCSANTSVFPCQFHSTGAPLLGKRQKIIIIIIIIIVIFITGLHKKPQGCGASAASAAGPFTTKRKSLFCSYFNYFCWIRWSTDIKNWTTYTHIFACQAVKPHSSCTYIKALTMAGRLSEQWKFWCKSVLAVYQTECRHIPEDSDITIWRHLWKPFETALVHICIKLLNNLCFWPRDICWRPRGTMRCPELMR